MEIPGGGQIVVQGNYAYIGHMDAPHGTSIVDISDPKKPRLVSKIDLPNLESHTHKVRVVADNIMIVNHEQQRRNFFRKGKQIPILQAKLQNTLGRQPTDTELARTLNVKVEDIPLLANAEKRGYNSGGFRIYDISDRTKPRELAFQKTGGFGVHRFGADEQYAYISTEMDGYKGNILVIYDIRNPERPREVSRWWDEGQKLNEGEIRTWEMDKKSLHHTVRWKNQLWAGYWRAGFRVIDIGDIAKPRTIGSYDYHPPIQKPTHTAFRVPFPLAGKEIALVIDEEHGSHYKGQPHAFLWLFDVGDLTRMKPLSTFHVSEADSPWSRVPDVRFGAHQFQEHLDSTLVFATWFAGGLRVIDIADPFLPKEAGYFIPEPGAGFKAPQSNDVDVDTRGLIYLIDRNVGFDILEFNG
jgi:hypothetical protein